MDDIVQAIVDDMDEEEFVSYVRAIKKRFSREAGLKAVTLVDSKLSFKWMQTIAREGAIAAIRQIREETNEHLLTCKIAVETLEEINKALLPLEPKNECIDN